MLDARNRVDPKVYNSEMYILIYDLGAKTKSNHWWSVKLSDMPKGMDLAVPQHDKAWLRENYPRVPVRADKHGKGRYTLSRGAHGKVVLAKRRSDGMDVVIKSEAHHPRVAYERQLLALATKHRLPHVLPLLDIADGPRKYYTVMPLADPLPRNPTLQEAQHIMAGVIAGVQGLEAIGIHHRDVKRKNLLMYQGEACLLDLGKSAGQAGWPYNAIFARANWRKTGCVYSKLLKQARSPWYQRCLGWDLWRCSADLLDGQRLAGRSGIAPPTCTSHVFCCLPMMGCMALEGLTAWKRVYPKHLAREKTRFPKRHGLHAEAGSVLG